MTRRLFLTRPQPGWDASAQLARSSGITVAGEPLFTVEPVAWTPPDPLGFDEVLIGSANALRHAGAGHAGRGLVEFTHLSAYVVGEATAEAAREAGFRQIVVGDGSLQPLLDSIADQPLKLLRLAGEAHINVAVPPAITIDTCIVYRTVPQPLSDEFAGQLRDGGVVALHSGEAARHFAGEVARRNIDRSRLTLAALAPRVATLAGDGWQAVHIADRPRDLALLAMARDLCQTEARGENTPRGGGGSGSQNG